MVGGPVAPPVVGQHRQKLSSLAIRIFFLELGASFSGILTSAAGAWVHLEIRKGGGWGGIAC